MIAKLLLILVLEPKSQRPVIRAVIVFPAFCCAAVTTLGANYKQRQSQLVGDPVQNLHYLALQLSKKVHST